MHTTYKRPSTLQFGLLGLGGQVGHEEVTHFCGGLVEEVAHAVGAEALADDVEVQARKKKKNMLVQE
jgi:hypothetical protein